MSVPASSPLAQKKIEYFNLLRALEKLAVVLYRKESAVITKLRLSHEPVRFEKGFATCKAWGRIFVFHALSQRVICQELCRKSGLTQNFGPLESRCLDRLQVLLLTNSTRHAANVSSHGISDLLGQLF